MLSLELRLRRVLRLLPVRLLFLIRTSGDHMTRPLDASTLDILDLPLLGSSSFLSFVSSNKRQFNHDFQSLFMCSWHNTKLLLFYAGEVKRLIPVLSCVRVWFTYLPVFRTYPSCDSVVDTLSTATLSRF